MQSSENGRLNESCKEKRLGPQMVVDNVEMLRLKETRAAVEEAVRNVCPVKTAEGCIQVLRENAFELRPRHRIPRGKKRHLVAAPYKLLGQETHHRLGAAVFLWRHRLPHRTEDSDAH